MGLSALMISIADWLSSHVGVGSSIESPDLLSADHMHLTLLTAVTAVIGSASVKLSDVID